KNCDYVVYKLRFGVRGHPDAFLNEAVAANLAGVRFDLRDRLPAGLQIVDVVVNGDGTDAGGGAMPAYEVGSTVDLNDTLTISDFRISASDLDGAGGPGERSISIRITAKIDQSAFPAAMVIENQAFVKADRESGPSAEI